MKTLNHFFSLSFPIWAIAAGLVAFQRPDTFTFILPHIKLGLGIIMFGMGSTLQLENLKRIIQKPQAVAIGLLGQFIIMPLLAWIIARAFGFGPELAIGFILLGACPGGTASNVIAYLARADVALSVAMTTASTLLAPIITPTIILLIAGSWMQTDAASLFWAIAQIVLIPVILGVLAQHFLGKWLQRLNDILPVISIVFITLIVGAVIGRSSATLASIGWLVIAGVVLHNCAGLGLGYGLGKATRLDIPQRRTLAIEIGMQNSGLAAALAVAHFSPEAAVPAALFSAWHNITGPSLAALWSRSRGTV
ncbi:MAG: bile acid:sodium symporter family protein [Opitutales bacterium]